jgi:uncharacterized protein (TIGR02996 family)
MHPEADALLDAIFDTPDDDTPRLVYADWLQEHGQENYAEFIRLCVTVARRVLPREERLRLRQRRHALGRELVRQYPHAAELIDRTNPPDGIPREKHVDHAAPFLEQWPHWWPFVWPRRLWVMDVCGYEAAVASCEYLRRVVELDCDGTFLGSGVPRNEHEGRQPVRGELLAVLAGNPHIRKLIGLHVSPIRASGDQLLGFASSPLAQQLHKLILWVEFPDGSRESIRETEGSVDEAIRAFVARHSARFAVQPA